MPQFLVGQMVLHCSHYVRTVVHMLIGVVVHGIGLGGSVGVPIEVLSSTRYEVGIFRLYR